MLGAQFIIVVLAAALNTIVLLFVLVHLLFGLTQLNNLRFKFSHLARQICYIRPLLLILLTHLSKLIIKQLYLGVF